MVQTIGFAIDCKGRDPEADLKAFGDVFLDSDYVEVIAENDLNTLFGFEGSIPWTQLSCEGVKLLEWS